MTSRDPHIPVRHARSARTRAPDSALARIGARAPLLTNDPVLQGLADLVADIDLVVDRVAPAPRSSVEPRIVLTGEDATMLPADDENVRPLVRRRQTWSVLTASGIAASFVAASLLSSSSPSATTSPSLSAAAETKVLLTHATKILPSATASSAAQVAYARELAADLAHAAALLPQVEDPQAHASLAEQLATLQQHAPAPPTTRPSGAGPQRPALGTARASGAGPSTAAGPTGQPTAGRAGQTPPTRQSGARAGATGGTPGTGSAQLPPPPSSAPPGPVKPLHGTGPAGTGAAGGAGTGAQQPPAAGEVPPRLSP